ncbi:MAG: HEAT repeat domain-containing protein [Bryobacteraceae bacterium]
MYFLVSAFAVLLVLFPFLFWRGTWFGRQLTDEQTESYLMNYKAKPRDAQHALVQIGERLTSGHAEVKRWFPKVLEASQSPSIELRQTAAWIMGQDHTYKEFEPALQKLLLDPAPMVRRNAALSLSNFRVDVARSELRNMLRVSSVTAPAAGAIRYRLKVGEFVNPGTLVARVGDVEVRAQLPGEVRALLKAEGSQVAAQEAVADISPDKEHAWEALRALYIVGQNEDLEDVQRYARGVPGAPQKLQQQATLTMQAIQGRAAR